MLLRFSSVSLLTALLDYALFAALIVFFPLWLALPLARITAAVFQFVMVRALRVFRAGQTLALLLR